MTPGANHDVAIVGAGVIGLASAWRLAQRGASVVVVDPAPGSGASGVAAGMLAPVTEARLGEDALRRLNRASWSRWPDFAAEMESAAGRTVGFRADGTLMVALDHDDRAVLDDLAARHRAMGLAVEPLRGREARALEPGLAPGVRAGLLAADERSVDPTALLPALRTAAEAAGANVVVAEVDGVVVDDAAGRATGVALEGGDVLTAGTVVVAAGCRSATLPGMPEAARPPVRPVKGQILTLAQPPGDPLLSRTVRGIVRGASVYLVPRDDGRVALGATVEERGWDTAPTAGGAYGLLRDALALVPGLDDAAFVAARAALRPGSPDDLPIVGDTAVEGLVVATGHHRNGILLTPITAEAVAATIAGGAVPDEVRPCDPRRFGPPAVHTSAAAGPGAEAPR